MRLAYKAETHELSAWRSRMTMELHTERIEAAATPPEPDSPYHQSGLRVCKLPPVPFSIGEEMQSGIAHEQHVVVESRMSQLNDGSRRPHLFSTRAPHWRMHPFANATRAGVHVVGCGAGGAVRSV